MKYYIVAIAIVLLIAIGAYQFYFKRPAINNAPAGVPMSFLKGSGEKYDSLIKELSGDGHKVVYLEDLQESFPWHLFPSSSAEVETLKSNTPFVFSLNIEDINKGALSMNVCLFINSEKPFCAVLGNILPFSASDIKERFEDSNKSAESLGIVFGLNSDFNIYARLPHPAPSTILINDDILNEESAINRYETHLAPEHSREFRLLGVRLFVYNAESGEKRFGRYEYTADIDKMNPVMGLEADTQFFLLPNDEVAFISQMTSAVGLYNQTVTDNYYMVGAGPLPFDPQYIVYADDLYYYRLEKDVLFRSHNRIPNEGRTDKIIENMTAQLDFELNRDKSVIIPYGKGILVVDFANQAVTYREFQQ